LRTVRPQEVKKQAEKELKMLLTEGGAGGSIVTMENRKVDEEADDKARKGRNMRDPLEQKLVTGLAVIAKVALQ
jgi:hypothetical protein